MKTNPNCVGSEPANPEHYQTGPDQALNVRSGLTKREYFAAMAMQGFLSCNDDQTRLSSPERIAERSVMQSDALIAALNKELA